MVITYVIIFVTLFRKLYTLYFNKTKQNTSQSVLIKKIQDTIINQLETQQGYHQCSHFWDLSSSLSSSSSSSSYLFLSLLSFFLLLLLLLLPSSFIFQCQYYKNVLPMEKTSTENIISYVHQKYQFNNLDQKETIHFAIKNVLSHPNIFVNIIDNQLYLSTDHPKFSTFCKLCIIFCNIPSFIKLITLPSILFIFYAIHIIKRKCK
ncbi:unnamed protein product [Cunninghamella blakesleeana]